MPASDVPLHEIAASDAAVATLFVRRYERAAPRVSIPRPEIQLVARFGPAARDGLDVHLLGARQQVHRKLILGGQCVVGARLRLGMCERAFGVPACAVAGRTVAIDDLWDAGAARRLCDRLADARDGAEAAVIVEHAIAARIAALAAPDRHARLVTHAADRLTSGSVRDVAAGLGMSERHLRRVFLETVGLSPKAFARVARFRRAVRAAREGRDINWAGIAAATGFCDQAHLIDEFRAIAGATPAAFLRELDDSLLDAPAPRRD